MIETESNGVYDAGGIVRGSVATEEAARGTRAMKNMNTIFGEPVSIQVDREAGQQEGQHHHSPLFP